MEQTQTIDTKNDLQLLEQSSLIELYMSTKCTKMYVKIISIQTKYLASCKLTSVRMLKNKSVPTRSGFPS